MAEQPSKTATPRFTKKRVALCAAVVLFAAVIGLLVANHDSTPMPVYQGKTAREWLYEMRVSNSRQPMDAFEHMGSNAVPFLVHELARRDTFGETFYLWIYLKLPKGIRSHFVPPVNASFRRILAADCLVTVNSRTAVPPLLRLQAEGDQGQKTIASIVLNLLEESKNTNAPK